MAANILDVGNVKNLDGARRDVITIGATAVTFGMICKITSGLLVVISASDVPTATRMFVSLANADASATKSLYCPFEDVVLSVSYSGGTPTVGVSYALSTGTNIDVTNTTNKAFLVTSVDTDKQIAWGISHLLSA